MRARFGVAAEDATFEVVEMAAARAPVEKNRRRFIERLLRGARIPSWRA